MAGTIVADTLQDGAGNSTAMDNAIYGSAKAWVNFNGTNASIRASYNISSVTRNSIGYYTISFTNPLSDANYAVIASAQSNTTSLVINPFNSSYSGLTTPTTSSFTVAEWASSGGAQYDTNYAMVAVFR